MCGSHYEKEVLVDATVYTYVVGMHHPMPGIAGGRPGTPNELVIRYGSADPYRVEHTADHVPIAAGERVMFDYGGGGGCGDPLDREPHAVLDEYVSVPGAACDYGVVLAGSLEDLSLAVDHDATEALRAARHAPKRGVLHDHDFRRVAVGRLVPRAGGGCSSRRRALQAARRRRPRDGGPGRRRRVPPRVQGLRV
ncbi:MAG: hypothetical protein FJW88_12450 [Actinobacteria bacterium]|nr:hypothetical protein [Actinomycetota bacterium]